MRITGNQIEARLKEHNRSVTAIFLPTLEAASRRIGQASNLLIGLSPEHQNIAERIGLSDGGATLGGRFGRLPGAIIGAGLVDKAYGFDQTWLAYKAYSADTVIS